MRTASPYLVLALILGVGAAAWGLIQPALRAEGGSADPQVSEKEGTVSNIGEQAEKIDHPGEEEEKVPDYVEVGPTTTLIQSLPYNPPIGWAFNPFPQANPWEHVDIHNKPPDAIQKRVVPPTSLNDTAGRVQIEGLFDNASVPDWPLRCEGNLNPGGGGGGGGGGEPAEWFWAAKTLTAEVDIKEDPISQGREWWPKNSKLLITAEHGLLAVGTPTSPTAIYVWEDHLGDQTKFNPNSTPKNPDLVGHWTKFTAPDVATPPEDRDNQKIQVQYKLYNQPTDSEPLAITAPTSATSDPASIPDYQSPEIRVSTSGGTLPIFHQTVLYHVRDQLGDGIHTSDRGNGDGERDLVSKEDVPWDSGITPVMVWLKTVPISDKWHESTHLENNGYIQDDMNLDCPISTLIGQDPVHNKFIEVNTHDWLAAVAKKDLSGRAGDKRLCHNHFLVDITSFRIEGTFAYVRYTRTYNIQLD